MRSRLRQKVADERQCGQNSRNRTKCSKSACVVDARTACAVRSENGTPQASGSNKRHYSLLVLSGKKLCQGVCTLHDANTITET